MMSSTFPLGIPGSVVSLLAATLIEIKEIPRKLELIEEIKPYMCVYLKKKKIDVTKYFRRFHFLK